MRWYSKTFSTPLATVEDLPVEDVLAVYYEEIYEEMDEEARAQERAHLLLSEEEEMEAMSEEDENDIEAWRLQQEQEALEKKAKAKKAKQEKLKLQSSGKIAEVEPKSIIGKVDSPGPLWDRTPPNAPPSMSMTFDVDVDEDILGDDFGMTGVKKR